MTNLKDSFAEVSTLNEDTQAKLDLFICNIINASPKDDLGSMEYPVFALSTKRNSAVRRYEREGIFIEITPSVLGHATIFDNDILIYCVSQLVAAQNLGREIGRTLRFSAFDFFAKTHREAGGKEYTLLSESLIRLRGTTITTNLTTEDPNTGELTKLVGAGLIENFAIFKKSAETEQIGTVEITISRWLFNAIQAKEVLTLDHKYFQLRKALERRLYLLARKHCGNQANWKIGLELLLKKCGSESEKKEFRRMMKVIIKNNNLPEYKMTFIEVEDSVLFTNRSTKKIATSLIEQISLRVK